MSMSARLSDHCSLMAQQSEPKPKVRPADCPKDAAYIKTVDKGGEYTLAGASFPIVFEGGGGDDKVTVVGDGGQGIIVDGGRGNDSLTIHNGWSFVIREIGPGASLALAALTIVFVTIGLIAWRAQARR